MTSNNYGLEPQNKHIKIRDILQAITSMTGLRDVSLDLVRGEGYKLRLGQESKTFKNKKEVVYFVLTRLSYFNRGIND